MTKHACHAWLVTLIGTMSAATIAAAQSPSGARPQSDFAIVRLGALARTYSEGIDINDRGQVLAQTENATGLFRPMLWDRGRVIDLVNSTASTNFFGLALNNRGQVLGYFNAGPGGEEHAFLVDHKGFTDLGTLGGAYMLPAGGPQSLNEKGQVVGDSTTADGEWRAVIWRQGTFTEIGTLPGDAVSSSVAINNAGQVVGVSGTNFGEFHGFLWTNGRLTDLGTLGGPSSQPFALNDRGQVVGTSSTSTGESHAFLWQQGQLFDLGMPGETSVAYRINARGQVLGSVQGADGVRRAVVWTDGIREEIEALPGAVGTSGFALNNRGQVVGISAAVVDNQLSGSAFLWQDGVITDLGVLRGGRLSLAFDINQRGDVTGYSYGANDGNEYQQGVLWTRRPIQ